jgi:hypothetical protein
MALTNYLSSIADAIRAKDGTTSPIIATEFPQRILDIPNEESSCKFVSGTFTLSEDVRIVWNQYSFSPYTLKHNLGVIPSFAFMYTDANTTGKNDSGKPMLLAGDLIWSMYMDCGFYKQHTMRTYNSTNGIASDVNGFDSTETIVTENNFYIGSSTACFLRAGYTYKWVAGVI